jgi:ribosomal protein L3 glutamine methyltransferase
MPERYSTATRELATLRDWLRYAVSEFERARLCYGHGTDNAHDEALWLLCAALRLPLDRPEPFLDARLTAPERRQLAALLRRRIVDRVPTAYLTGEAWLGEYRFAVDERVIVPRSHIAVVLRDGLLEPWLPDAGAVRAALDLGTGSGCLAVLLAQAYPDAAVMATELSADALEVARTNVARYRLQERITLALGSLYEPLGDARFDLIVSNPPYVPVAAMRSLPGEYRHEPRLALAGGRDGLDLVRPLLAGALDHLQPHAVLVVEVGAYRRAVEDAFPALPLTWLETGADEPAVFLVTREELAAALPDAGRPRAGAAAADRAAARPRR